MRRFKKWPWPVAVLLSLSITGCAVLFGQIGSLEEQAQQHLHAPRLASPWRVTEISNPETDADVSYQHDETGSSLSLTSGCRKFRSELDSDREIRRIAASMTGGLKRITSRTRTASTLDGVKAMDSSVSGIMDGRKVVIRSRIARKGDCVFDVTLVALERFFDADNSVFEDWVSRIRLP